MKITVKEALDLKKSIDKIRSLHPTMNVAVGFPLSHNFLKLIEICRPYEEQLHGLYEKYGEDEIKKDDQGEAVLGEDGQPEKTGNIVVKQENLEQFDKELQVLLEMEVNVNLMRVKSEKFAGMDLLYQIIDGLLPILQEG